MITVITGPPCSGKSTYARAHARGDDIVIDFDVIAQALGSQVTHGHSPHILDVAERAWSAAIREAIDQHKQGHRAWIVDSRPTAYRRAQYLDAGATMVRLDADPAELHARADESRPPSWHARIDQYLAAAREPRPAGRTRW